MLPRAHRGLQRSDFHQIYKSGKTLKTAFFRIKTAPIEDSDHQKNRFAVVISAKTLKGAVKRNRLRRQIYAILAEIQPHLQKQAIIVVVPEQTAIGVDFVILRADMIAGLMKIGFLKSDSARAS